MKYLLLVFISLCSSAFASDLDTTAIFYIKYPFGNFAENTSEKSLSFGLQLGLNEAQVRTNETNIYTTNRMFPVFDINLSHEKEGYVTSINGVSLNPIVFNKSILNDIYYDNAKYDYLEGEEQVAWGFPLIRLFSSIFRSSPKSAIKPKPKPKSQTTTRNKNTSSKKDKEDKKGKTHWDKLEGAMEPFDAMSSTQPNSGSENNSNGHGSSNTESTYKKSKRSSSSSNKPYAAIIAFAIAYAVVQSGRSDDSSE
ncbi:MAG: hypothetical protein AB2689_21705 [Candidatus Thiodiazotropha taylori]